MSKFPIANAIKREREVLMMCDGADKMFPHTFYESFFEQAVFFDISISAQLYWTGRKDYYRLDKDFGPLRPPYPVMWCEWEIPRHVQIEERWHDRGHASHHGALVCSGMTSPVAFEVGNATGSRLNVPGPQTVLGIEVASFLYHPERDMGVFLPYAKIIGLDPETGVFDRQHCIGALPPDPISPEDEHMAKELAEANVVWMALNLINCRNVTTKQIGTALHRTSREKRQGVPNTRYHTIVLPGMQTRYHGTKGASQQRCDLAAHLVRGHFKTYTPEAPLLGKHTGTYWWGWQARGDKSHGEVIKDYKLGETG
jgi:hypothetical protein